MSVCPTRLLQVRRKYNILSVEINIWSPGKIFNIDNTRFFTYAGLVVATCIILHKNLAVASVVGGVVAAYISFTEYYLANNDIRNSVTLDEYFRSPHAHFFSPSQCELHQEYHCCWSSPLFVFLGLGTNKQPIIFLSSLTSVSVLSHHILTLSVSGDLQPTPATLDTIKQQFQQGNFGPM